MLVLTDRHLMFIHKTDANPNWWKAITSRQVINLIKSKNTMIIHDGYTEKELTDDLDIEKNVEISFDDISKITHEEKDWGKCIVFRI